MRAVLQAITEELQRLKADGEHTVAVSDETLAGLRALVAAHTGKAAKAGAAAAVSAEAGGPGAEAAAAGATTIGTEAKSAFANWQPKPDARVEAARVRPAAPGAMPASAAVPVVKLPPPPVVTLPEGDKAARWAALLALAAADPVCVSNLRAGKRVVIGAGSLEAKIFFVGDALGSEAGRGGDAFAGPVGQTLGKMAGAMGLKAADVYVGNLVCWRPPVAVAAALTEQSEGKAPTADELAYGLPFLQAAIELVQPELIVALGGSAAQALLGGKFTKLPEVRSRWHEFAGVPLMVTYHPSYVLQSNSAKAKRAVWEDLLQVMERAELPISAKQRGYFL
jgi:DNA polymerase